MSHPSTGPISRHGNFPEGVIAGILGASSVAVWLLIVDTIGARPFHTPAVLGAAAMNALGWEFSSTLIPIIIYTIFHFAAFILAGIIVVAVVHASEREPSLLLGFLILFVAFEVGFYGMIYFLDLSVLGSLAWMQVGLANLLAAFVMGRYLWRSHPALRGRLDEGLSGR